jgi:hypothetical protein
MVAGSTEKYSEEDRNALGNQGCWLRHLGRQGEVKCRSSSIVGTGPQLPGKRSPSLHNPMIRSVSPPFDTDLLMTINTSFWTVTHFFSASNFRIRLEAQLLHPRVLLTPRRPWILEHLVPWQKGSWWKPTTDNDIATVARLIVSYRSFRLFGAGTMTVSRCVLGKPFRKQYTLRLDQRPCLDRCP